jgi:UDP-glucose 4-epimerase
MPEADSTHKKLIVVTGGAGFIGSHLVERLVALGHSVISLDNYFTGSKENHVPGAEYREGHTKDIAKLIPETPDLVYHLGEYSRVEQSFEDHQMVWDYNIAGTHAVLEYCRNKGCKIVYAGSSTKFGDGGLGRNQSPYAWTKATNTELVKNYGQWFGLPYAITYFYNVYGGREIKNGRYATLIALFKEKFKKGEPLTVVAPGTQKRNFTHVEDILNALVAVGERGEGDDFGIGHDRSYSILEVAELFGKPVEMLPARPGNRMTASVETEKTKTLGWEPKQDLEEHIREFLKSA